MSLPIRGRKVPLRERLTLFAVSPGHGTVRGLLSRARRDKEITSHVTHKAEREAATNLVPYVRAQALFFFMFSVSSGPLPGGLKDREWGERRQNGPDPCTAWRLGSSMTRSISRRRTREKGGGALSRAPPLPPCPCAPVPPGRPPRLAFSLLHLYRRGRIFAHRDVFNEMPWAPGDGREPDISVMSTGLWLTCHPKTGVCRWTG